MLFVTGPLYSGKRAFSQKFGGRQICDVVISTEIGGGIVPIDPAERAAREDAGRLACLLAARASCVVEMFCGLPTVLKGELPKC